MTIELLLAFVLTGPPVTVVGFDGDETAGELTAWSVDSLVLDGTEEIAKSGVLSVRFGEGPPGVLSEAAPVVVLRDGGQIAATTFTKTGRDVTVATAYGALTTPATAVRSVRFKPAGEAIFRVWKTIADAETDADLFVRLRGDTPDRVECVVGDITESTVNIRARGRDLPVPVENTFGLVFRGDAASSRPAAVVILKNGSRLTASTVEVSVSDSEPAAPLSVRVAGQDLKIPLEDVYEIDLASGRVVSLVSLEPTRVRYDGFGPVFDEFAWRLRTDRNAVGEPLRLDGQAYDRGIWIHSGTVASYALPAGATRFQATVGIDELETPGQPVKLTVKADQTELFRETIEPEKPQQIDVDLSGRRELTLQVDTLKPDGYGIREHLAVIGGRLILE